MSGPTCGRVSTSLKFICPEAKSARSDALPVTPGSGAPKPFRLIGTLGGLPVATALRFAGPAWATCAEMARIHTNSGIIRVFISILFARPLLRIFLVVLIDAVLRSRRAYTVPPFMGGQVL